MENYNFNENAITAPDLLKGVDDCTDDLVVAFINTKYTNNAKAVFQLSGDLRNYLKSGEKGKDFHIEDVIFGVLLGKIEVLERVSANVWFNVESGKYELYIVLGDTAFDSSKFFREGKIFDNLEDAVCQK